MGGVCPVYSPIGTQRRGTGRDDNYVRRSIGCRNIYVYLFDCLLSVDITFSLPVKPRLREGFAAGVGMMVDIGTVGQCMKDFLREWLALVPGPFNMNNSLVRSRNRRRSGVIILLCEHCSDNTDSGGLYTKQSTSDGSARPLHPVPRSITVDTLEGTVRSL